MWNALMINKTIRTECAGHKPHNVIFSKLTDIKEVKFKEKKKETFRSTNGINDDVEDFL